MDKEYDMVLVVYDKGLMQLAKARDVYCQTSGKTFPWGEWRDEPFKVEMPLPTIATAPEL